MIYRKDILCVKKEVRDNLGKEISLKQRGSKHKVKDAILIEAYKSLFLVNIKIDDNIYTSTTFTYKDLITQNVVITIK